MGYRNRNYHRRWHKPAGISLVEVLVVIGIVTVLIGLSLGVVSRVRGHADRTRCASNLRQLYTGFTGYASENRGVAPRAGRYEDATRPLWTVAISAHLGLPPTLSWQELSAAAVYKCPSHPIRDNPSSFVLNTFAFESRPQWEPSPPVQLGRVQTPSSVLWLVEAADKFGVSGVFDDIYFEPQLMVHRPDHLPTGSKPRMASRRHVNATLNALYADGHVDVLQAGALRLEAFDDGLRSR